MKRRPLRTFGLIAIIAVSVAAAAQTAPPSGDVNPAVLEVNGEKIYAAQITMAMQNIAAQVGGRDKIENEQALVGMATQRMVEQKLLAQEARRKGIQPDELRVAQMTQSVERQAGGKEKLVASLSAFGASYERLVETIREMDLARSLIEREVTPTIQVTEQDARAYYDQNPELFEAEAQVHARHIIFNAPTGSDAKTVETARANAEKARARAVAGEDFAELAREVSEGPSAAKGGDLGFFTFGQTEPTFAEAAFALDPGQVSEVVRTKFGFHIIKVEEKRPAGRLPFEQVAEHVQNLLVQERTGDVVGRLVDTLAEDATIINLVDGTPLGESPPG